MQLPALIVSDLHLDESPSTEYRWALWPWLAETIKEERARTLLILGDLTDKKDNHPSELVNRIVRGISDLKRDCPGVRIVILTGNHDWLKGGEEFFRFLNQLPDVTFVTRPWEDDDVKGETAFFLPYSKNPVRDWAGLDFSHYRYLFMHQTVKGSISSNGTEMEGEELPDLNADKVYSGDIHVPQVVKTAWGAVEYVGSPYHVHFGDDFKPRAVLLEKGGRAIDLHFKSPRRVAVRAQGLDGLERALESLKPGDHVKVKIVLAEADKHGWSRIRREASDLLTAGGLGVHGLELEVEKSERRIVNEEQSKQHRPEEALYRFVRAESLTADAYDIAMEVIEDEPAPPVGR